MNAIATDRGARGLSPCIPIQKPITVATEGGLAEIGSVFASPYEQHAERIGQCFHVLGAVDPDSYDFQEVGPMYRIVFADGALIDAWPEEVEVPVGAHVWNCQVAGASGSATALGQVGRAILDLASDKRIAAGTTDRASDSA